MRSKSTISRNLASIRDDNDRMEPHDHQERMELGRLGEDRAVALYQDWGYELVARNDNYHRLGELDFVARREGVLAFVEVRTRATDSGGHPLESVTAQKRAKIIRAAVLFWDQLPDARRAGIDELRFDVVGVVQRPFGLVITPILGAFETDRVW
jgi:putative endonuclease